MATKKDGHTHTQFSHHGSADELDMYIEAAIAKKVTTYVVTEHAPLPHWFLETYAGPLASRDTSAMTETELLSYIMLVQAAQRRYAGRIDIRLGLELDYLVGFESDTLAFLQKYSKYLDELIISVHFLPDHHGNLQPIDFTAESLAVGIPTIVTDPQSVFETYYETLGRSCQFILQQELTIPVRIGHPTLIRKYQRCFNLPDYNASVCQMFENVLDQMAAGKLELDVNTAGLDKPDCGEIYPPLPWIRAAQKRHITLTYGSDAHTAHDVGRYYDYLQTLLRLPENNAI